MKIQKNLIPAAFACTIIVAFSLFTRESSAQRAWYILFAIIGIAVGYILFKTDGSVVWPALLYGLIAVLASFSILLNGSSFTHGRWLTVSPVKPLVNLYIPGLFVLLLPLIIWLRDQQRSLLVATTLGLVLLLSLLTQSIDGYLVVTAALFAILDARHKVARVIVLLLFALFCFSRCYHDLLLPFDIPVAQWEGIHLLGPSHVQTADIRFLTSVLDDPAFITAEVLYRFGALPCALLLISFAILLARLIDDKQKGTYSIRVRTACFVLFTSRLVIHLLSVVVLISRGDQVAQTYMPLTGSNCAVMAEFALIIWIFLGNHIWKHDNAPS